MVDVPRAHGLLSAAEIKARIEEGEIFVEGTFLQDKIRPASYDLRIADDEMQIPLPSGKMQTYERAARRSDPFVLHPGDVAFVTSKEQLRIPLNIAANIGIKFGLASRGVLVHTGLLIHPGFGLDQDKGRRLHFLIANLSSEEVAIIPGETEIAGLQFFSIKHDDDRQAVSTKGEDAAGTGGPRLTRDHIEQGMPLRSLRSLSALSRAEEMDRRIGHLESAGSNVILFGVYVVAAALLGVSLTALLTFAANAEAVATLGAAFDRLNPSATEAVILISGMILVVVLFRIAIGALGSALLALARGVIRSAEWLRQR